jgi:hypothetical protein
MTDHTIEDGWRQIELNAPVSAEREFRVFDTGLETPHGAALLALDSAGLRHLLLPVGAEFPASNDRRSGGVHLTTRSLVDASATRQYLDLACQKQHLNGVFTHMANEVLDALRAGGGEPLAACRQTLQRWRELLDREAPPGGLSTEALCGLFGELWHLSRVTLISPDGLNTWQGPFGARHDFSVAAMALEVKTTTQRDTWKLRIHGLTQLECPRDATLFLSAMRLELNGASGTTVPDMIHEVMQHGVDRKDLLNRLSLLGYDLRDETQYRQLRIALIEVETFEVTEAFPRLTTASFGAGPPTGVSDLHYTIDLSAAVSASLPRENQDALHDALARGANAAVTGPSV